MAENDDEGNDILVVGPDMGNGLKPYVRHRPNHEVEPGIMREAAEGEEASMDLKAIGPNTYRVVRDSNSGPPKVTNNAYRKGWGNIFGSKQVVGEA